MKNVIDRRLNNDAVDAETEEYIVQRKGGAILKSNRHDYDNNSAQESVNPR